MHAGNTLTGGADIPKFGVSTVCCRRVREGRSSLAWHVCRGATHTQPAFDLHPSWRACRRAARSGRPHRRSGRSQACARCQPPSCQPPPAGRPGAGRCLLRRPSQQPPYPLSRGRARRCRRRPAGTAGRRRRWPRAEEHPCPAGTASLQVVADKQGVLAFGWEGLRGQHGSGVALHRWRGQRGQACSRLAVVSGSMWMRAPGLITSFAQTFHRRMRKSCTLPCTIWCIVQPSPRATSGRASKAVHSSADRMAGDLYTSNNIQLLCSSLLPLHSGRAQSCTV